MNKNVSPEQLKSALQQVYAAERTAIACDEASVRMAQLVESGQIDQSLKTAHPSFFKHLAGCADCRGELKLLLALADAESRPIEIKSIPPLPDQKSLWEKLVQTADQLIHFSGFNPQTAHVLRSDSLSLMSAEIEIDSETTVILDPDIDSSDSELRSLLVSVETTQTLDLEGVTLMLFAANHEGTGSTYSGALDAFGSGVINSIREREGLILQINLKGKLVHIQDISIS